MARPKKEESKKNAQKALGFYVKEARKGKGMTQQELGKAVGCHLSHVSHLEQGRGNLSDEKLIKVAQVLGLDKNILVAKREAPSTKADFIPAPVAKRRGRKPKAEKAVVEAKPARRGRPRQQQAVAAPQAFEGIDSETYGLQLFAKARAEAEALNFGNSRSYLEEAKQRIKDSDVLKVVNEKLARIAQLTKSLGLTSEKQEPAPAVEPMKAEVTGAAA